jgi:arsenate reductase
MAEGFARTYGSDVIEPVSAGLAPAAFIQPLTRKVMLAKNIDISEQHAKDLSQINLPLLDLIINMSGRPLPPAIPIEVRDWKVEDPIGREEDIYVSVRDQIENLVMSLILELRRGTRPPRRQPLRGILDRTERAFRSR